MDDQNAEVYRDANYWIRVLGGGTSAQHVVFDPRVREAISTGDPRVVRKAFIAFRKRAPSAEVKAAITAALENVVAFAHGPVNPPALRRVNGVGHGMYGRSNWNDEDHTYVKTRFHSVFWIPLVPADSWLVRDADKGWYFLAQVPLTRSLRLARGVMTALFAAVLLMAGAAFYNASSHTDLHLVNGLDMPVTVTIGEQSWNLGANGRTKGRIENDALELVCTDAAGHELERLHPTVSSRLDAVIYNVLGAAPVYVTQVPYASGARGEAKASAVDHTSWYAGSSWVALKKLDVAFRPPPDTVKIPSDKDMVIYEVAGLLEGGWRTAVAVVHEERSADSAAALAARVVCASAEVDGVTDDALAAVAAVRAPGAAKTVIDAWISGHPESGDRVRRFRERLDEPLPEPEPDPETDPEPDDEGR